MSARPAVALAWIAALALAALGPAAALAARNSAATPSTVSAVRDATARADTPTPVEDSREEQPSAESRPEAVPRDTSEASPAGTTESMGQEVADFRQREPDEGDPASQPTRAYVSYDDQNLHVVFVCEDDPTQIRARVLPRDAISDDDRVVVYLDTFDDNQRAYYFEANPLGIQGDGIITEGQDDDDTFDALWHSEGKLTENGFVVRFRIPFASLRFSDKPIQTWGIGLGRTIKRRNEKSFWPFITDRVEGFVNQLGTTQGLLKISPGRRFQVVPYSVMAQSRFLDDEPDIAAFKKTREERYGVDVKMVPHDAVTIDLAVKPDFSQVAPDDPQVTVNERFEVRVEEKRPFFIENAGFFQTPIELFFSRRIVDPSGGGRLTTKMGPWVIGGLFMNDREPGRVTAGDPMFGKQAYAGVMRIQRELPAQSTLGLFLSDRELDGDFNRVYGLDSRLKLDRNWVLTGQVTQAETREPDAPRVWGSGANARLKREGRFFDWSAEYLQFSPDFASQLGFVRRVGFREVENEWEYTFRPKKSLVDAWGPKINGEFVWGWDGRLQDAEVGATGKIELPADSQIEGGWAEVFELFEDQEFRLHEARISAETKWLKWLALSASYERGLAVNHDPADTIPGVPGEIELLPFAGQAQTTHFSVTLQPTSRVEFKQSLTHAWLRRVEHGANDAETIQPVFTNWILKSKLKLQLSRELSVRAIANYEGLIPNPAWSDEDEERELLPDVLVTYLLNPWTALHAGYTERFENVRLEDGEVVEEPKSTESIHLPRTSVDRQYFLKLSLLMRF